MSMELRDKPAFPQKELGFKMICHLTQASKKIFRCGLTLNISKKLNNYLFLYILATMT